MSHRDSELQAKLEAKAQAVIAELLADRKEPGEITLTEIEQAVRGAGTRFEQALTAALVQESARQLEPAWPRCPECGQRLKAKGKRRKRLVTETGEVSVEREYYHCAACGRGLFPPG